MPKLLPVQLGKILYTLTTEATEKNMERTITAFAQFVKQKHLTKKLPYIIKEFERFAKEQDGSQDISITSAKSINDSIIEKVKKSLNASKKAEVNVDINEELVGGLIVQQGNIILDGSIKTQIEKLRMNLNS